MTIDYGYIFLLAEAKWPRLAKATVWFKGGGQKVDDIAVAEA